MEETFLIKDIKCKKASTGNDFLTLTLVDEQKCTKTARMFNVTSDAKKLKAGDFVDVYGTVKKFNGSDYINVDDIEKIIDISQELKSRFVESAPISQQEIGKELNSYMTTITDRTYNSIITYLIRKYLDSFYDHSAAKMNHHDYQGGLAFHTLSILRLADFVANTYPGIDKQLLFAGTILHDFGKILELEGSPNFDYTEQGKLLGHIELCEQLIDEACFNENIDVNDEKVVLLKHMVCSHHGLRKYGSPVEPKIIEAEILHRLDGLDASICEMNKALDNVEDGQFTEKIFAMDNRTFLKH